MERLRAAGSHEVWRQKPLWKGLALGSAMAIGWPLVTFVDALKLSWRRSVWQAPTGFLETFVTLYRAALGRNVPPHQYAFHASLMSEPDELADLLLPLDLRLLHGMSIAQGAEPDDVQDKARFEKICRAHRLACVPTIATFSRGTHTGEEVLRKSRAPLFVKALTGNRGAGAELWTPSARGFVSSNGEELGMEELIDWLRPQNCIVQPVLRDHPVLQALGTVALSNIRLITAKAPHMPAVPITASLSLAVEQGSLTGHAGIHCGIDIATGALMGSSRPVEEDDRLVGREIAGLTLPDWGECVELACKAHDEAFPAFTTLGWDLALTAAGPVLLEANVNWRIIGHQKLTGPLGKTSLADIIDELLGPTEADRLPRGRQREQAAQSPSPAPRAGRAPAAAGSRTRRRPARKAS